jgi:Fe-S-cluster containining protein
MTDDKIHKNQMLVRLAYIYKLTDEFSGMCPPACTLCENRESLMLLPYEEELIQDNSGKKGQSNIFLKNDCGYYYQPLGFSCPMLHSSGSCKMYNKRPFDCRSFPVVPRFQLDKDNSIEFFLANSYCPQLQNLSSKFIKITIECWRYIAENLSSEWKTTYNKLNQHSYTGANAKTNAFEIEHARFQGFAGPHEARKICIR